MKRLFLLILLTSVLIIVDTPTSTGTEILEDRELSAQLRTRGHPGIIPSTEIIQMYRDQGLTPPRVADWPAPLPEAPVTGTRRILAILIDFPDHAGTQTQAYFSDLIFGTTQGKMKHYYTEVSNGLLTIQGQVAGTGWYRSAHYEDWWGDDSVDIDDANGAIFELAREAVLLADLNVNFALYDTDGDRILDPDELSICIVHAGSGQERTHFEYDIWSHRWYIYGQGYSYDGTPLTDTIVDGVRVSKHPGDYVGGYFMQAETSPMGTFAHEFGHDLGLPDLYDTDYTSEGIGDWGLMASGSWLGPSRDGTSPAHLCAWCKFKLGWITPTTITGATSGAIVNQIETSFTQSLYQVPITTGSDIEYFLIENRQPVGYDQFLPGSGVLIWHIDERQWITQNDDENHKLVDLEEADGLNHLDLLVNSGDATDTWYSNPTGFTGTSNPDSNSYSGALTGIEVNNISPSIATMTVDFQATQGWTQIAYDDGDPETAWSWTPGRMFAVRFTPSTSGELKTASFFIWEDPANFKVRVLDASRDDLISPLTCTPTSGGWFDVDLSAQSISTSTGVDFYIGMEFTSVYTPYLGTDQSNPDGRSWDWNGASWAHWPDEDYMIRAVVEPITLGPISLVGLLNFDDYHNRMGSVTPMAPSTTFYFPHFHQDSNWQTFVAIANPNDQEAAVTLTFYRGDGSTLDVETFNVPSNGKQGFLLSSLGVTGTGWVKVESSIPVVGILNFDDYANRMGSMSGVTPATQIYFPHFHQDANWQTYYAIVNPNDASASITIVYYANDGSVVSTESLTLNPRNKTGRFAVGGTGWIAVQSDQPIVGMLNFDDYHNRMGTIEHAVPSQTQYFPHFHQDANWQTYYAIANPSSTSATVTITYYGADGTIIQSTAIGLNAHSKYGTFAVSGQGWIKVESTVPIVGILNFDDYHNRMGSIVAVTSLESIVFPHFHQDSTWQTFYAIVNLGPSATFTSTYIRADGSTITSVSTTITTNSKLGRFATSGTGWLKIH